MKPQPPTARPSRLLSILWPVAVCAWVGVAGYWAYLSFFSGLSSSDVRAEGERVAPVLEDHKAKYGRYPKALEDTRVADFKFPRGLSVGYTPSADFGAYVLVVAGDGHTWRYHSGAAVWQLVPTGAAPVASPD